MDIRHFILTDEGDIREFTAEHAIRIANGAASVPSLAATRVRYLQVLMEAGDDDITIRTAGTLVRFDEEGVFVGVGADTSVAAGDDQDDEAIAGITAFEHDACVEFALKSNLPDRVTHH